MSTESLRLWDPVVRLFHLSIAGVFVANYFFNEAGGTWHVWLGYYAVTWLLVRSVWGFIGPRSARWVDFWPTPARLGAHLRSLLARRPMHRLGHSPLGALVMITMMLVLLTLGLSGWAMEEVDALWGADWPLQVHETAANVLLALVGLHIAAALFESLQVRDNLPLSMLTGRRRRLPDDVAQ
ncbi:MULTISPECIES: cytochrome b/b6 domain-containing protein [unclassified Pseudomonas]|uniref:cytochrome b/b6 domain-containing protein n=1 Tax=unclassified Pseudomonas TaxID=196821 RepID=UPI002AC92BDB|nr:MULTISPECIES: cytochrome b/b6 domain-containing protein [unclassified Pseudomonas]MEB0045544.1 cytochrome b/b6 domain-containing protein [Pseudomonas sp. Dout3]MEB0095427.1 cytochrome b/b6 domain-containing protein [Pseudomonas sp. DC1.2]WPX61011.1 cytochrome b/b6 domain-containing protein [Pseudomonas sp. DC1.2]